MTAIPVHGVMDPNGPGSEGGITSEWGPEVQARLDGWVEELVVYPRFDAERQALRVLLRHVEQLEAQLVDVLAEVERLTKESLSSSPPYYERWKEARAELGRLKLRLADECRDADETKRARRRAEAKLKAVVKDTLRRAAEVARKSNFVDGPEGTVEGQIARAILAPAAQEKP